MEPTLTRALWHGADYNPEQWLETPGIWDADMDLMNQAHMSSATIGIFSWTMLEPSEGEYNFGWMDDIFEKLSANGQKVVLATPSGAKPAWMAKKYPEIRGVRHGQREPQGGRHNHCYTSPVYREKIAQINDELSRRYGKHPALLAWHISNEFSGDCACDLCFTAFRDWLKVRYDNDLDRLNRIYWSRFWSHSYGDWEEIDNIDRGVHGLALDWRRFATHQTTDFMRHEIRALRAHSSAPATTNFMGTFTGLNYAAMAEHVDFICWDAYPDWGSAEIQGDETSAALFAAFNHDWFRGMKRAPFWLMECAPGQTNWRSISKLKAPGIHRLSGWQTIAHGGDAVMYFQWRQSRGSSEKFHAAVVSHEGTSRPRNFQEVAWLGEEMEALGEVAGSTTPAEIALIFDTENIWAIEGEQGPRNDGKHPQNTAQEFYAPLWKASYAIDVIESTADFAPYKLVIAPMLYMLRPGVAERLTEFVRNGGTIVTTYWTGLADENDLCFLGGFPGPLREVLGIWVEETDTLFPHQINTVMVDNPDLGLNGPYAARDYCDIVHPESAEVLATYGEDFYAGQPALTVNQFGTGRAYHIASRNEDRFQSDFLLGVAQQLQLTPALHGDLPPGVIAHRRRNAGTEWVWVLNFTGESQSWAPRDNGFEAFQKGGWQPLTGGEQIIEAYGVTILRRPV